MNDLNHLTNQNNVLLVSKALQTIANVIQRKKNDPQKKEIAIAEIDFLKEQCLSKNIQLSLFSCQTLYHLVENEVLQPENVLTMFITMLSNASTLSQCTAIGEGIVKLLLLNLTMMSTQLKGSEQYECPFGLKSPQHPIIMLLQKKDTYITDLANQIKGICNHRNPHIRENCFEFLRPVFIYVFCNPIVIRDSKSIWVGFLAQTTKSDKNLQLLYEIFRWGRITNETCLSTLISLTETIQHFLDAHKCSIAVEFQIYLVALLPSIIEQGHDPRPALSTIFRTLRECDDELKNDDYDYLLISLAQIIHMISPFYLISALQVIKCIIYEEKALNTITRNMILDALIVRLASNSNILSTEAITDAENCIKRIHKQNSTSMKRNVMQPQKLQTGDRVVAHFHPNITTNYNLARLCNQLAHGNTIVQSSIDRLVNILSNKQEFCREFHLFLRALLLCEHNSSILTAWMDIWAQLLITIKTDTDICCDTIYFVLYCLAKEIDGKRQLELLRGLAPFASVKENIPLILNTYRALSTSTSTALQTLSIDLYTRLWAVESRTYQFLHKILTTDSNKSLSVLDQWELNISRANSIKEICLTKASQHGTDLVGPLSVILTSCANNENDLATSLALDAIILLCNSHIVNVASTWKVLKHLFESDSRPRTIRSLCKFFGEIPLLRSPTDEYESLYIDSLQRLWIYVVDSDCATTIQCALQAMKNFNFADLPLKHVPAIFYEQIKIPNEYQKCLIASLNDPERKTPPLTAADVVPYIPGECWIKLLQKVNQNACDAALDLITHLIEKEISQFRSGVYNLGEGRGEPTELQHVHARSPLRAITKFLRDRSEKKNFTNSTLVAKCLQALACKFSRPLPPLNWFFLVEYINDIDDECGGGGVDGHNNNCYDMKKYALTIASNQIAHSGSARNLIENYLQEFDVGVKSSEDIQMAMELVPSMCNGVTPRILANFISETFALLYNESNSSNFERNSGFERAVAAVVEIFNGKCLVNENVDIIIDVLVQFDKKLDANSKIYERYATYLCRLPSETLHRLCTPHIWNAENFKKSLAVRTNAVAMSKPFTNPVNSLFWLNLVLDHAIEGSDQTVDHIQKDLLLTKLLHILSQWTDKPAICEWLMYLLGKVQLNFASEPTTENIANSQFSLDLFMLSIVAITGCSIFVDELTISNRLSWLKLFPEALWVLSKQTHWNECMPRIFEFLYHLNTEQANLPEEYVSIACQALVCSKNHEYFLQKSLWMKFIGLKPQAYNFIPPRRHLINFVGYKEPLVY